MFARLNVWLPILICALLAHRELATRLIRIRNTSAWLHVNIYDDQTISCE